MSGNFQFFLCEGGTDSLKMRIYKKGSQMWAEKSKVIYEYEAKKSELSEKKEGS